MEKKTARVLDILTNCMELIDQKFNDDDCSKSYYQDRIDARLLAAHRLIKELKKDCS